MFHLLFGFGSFELPTYVLGTSYQALSGATAFVGGITLKEAFSGNSVGILELHMGMYRVDCYDTL